MEEWQMASIRMRKTHKVITLAAIVMALAVFAFAAPANAAPGAVVFNGTATLDNGFPAPAGSTGSFSGTARGLVEGAVVLGPNNMTASYTYSEPCPPTTGTAAGTVTINGKSKFFNWTRAGLTAIVLLRDFSGGPINGVAVAVFVPSPIPPVSALVSPCSPKNVPQFASVGGIGAWTA
jgi:hypothetical protein